ncbi:MAG: nucleotidyl transferase AbiEii/AbiGii toxin family protein [Nitrospira sp.]
MITLHEDELLFKDAINLTAAETAFAARLIEKDYYCSVLLEQLAIAAGQDLVFKGGTCLAKVHGDFFRMSEDLDFAISMPVDSSRAERSRKVARLKQTIDNLPDSLGCFSITEPMQGANN